MQICLQNTDNTFSNMFYVCSHGDDWNFSNIKSLSLILYPRYGIFSITLPISNNSYNKGMQSFEKLFIDYVNKTKFLTVYYENVPVYRPLPVDPPLPDNLQILQVDPDQTEHMDSLPTNLQKLYCPNKYEISVDFYKNNIYVGTTYPYIAYVVPTY